MDRDSPKTTTGGTATAGPRLGRRIGILLFWVLAAYVVGMSSRSIITALFFPQYAPHPPASSTAHCAAELSELEQELVTRSAEHLRTRRVEGLQRWLAAWDQRYLALFGCGTLETTRVELGRVRDELETLLRDYAHTATLQQRIHRALEALKDGSPPPERPALPRKS